MDFKKLISRYWQFGGFRLVREYIKLGALWPAVKAGVRCLVKGQSFKAIYPEVLKCVEPMLVAKYRHVVQGFKSSSTSEATKSMTKFQGSSGSINENDNYQEFENSRINSTSKNSKLDTDPKLSTLNSELKHKMLEYLNAELFLFQYSRPGSKEISISNWFITARKNNEVLMVLREMLYAYWKDYDCVLDYYMFHLFFSMIAKEYPEEIAKMPYGYSPNSLVLLHHWGEKFDQKKWDKLTRQVGFHKLAFRVKDNIKNDKENYYNHILSLMG